MININGNDFYTAEDAIEILDMKYSSVIYLLRENNIPKYKNKYYLTKEQMNMLLNRKNQRLKSIFFDEDNLLYSKTNKISK